MLQKKKHKNKVIKKETFRHSRAEMLQKTAAILINAHEDTRKLNKYKQI